MSFTYYENKPEKDSMQWTSQDLQVFNKFIMREMPVVVNKASVQKNSKILVFAIKNDDNPRVFKSIGEVEYINILSKL